jgi:hypothetical protein
MQAKQLSLWKAGKIHSGGGSEEGFRGNPLWPDDGGPNEPKARAARFAPSVLSLRAHQSPARTNEALTLR